jgi:ribonuclease R
LRNIEEVYKYLSKSLTLLSVKEVSAGLNLTKSEAQTATRELIKAGKLKRVSGKLFTVHKPKSESREEITGRLSISREGYGFIEAGKGRDLFIPRSNLNSAQDGDVVTAAVSKRRGRKEGEILKIASRAHVEVVGRVYRNGLVFPISKSCIPPIVIDGKYSEGEILLIKITSFPSEGDYMKGEVLEKLGSIGDNGIENLIVMKNYGLTRTFSEEVEQNAAAVSEIPISAENRVDFRGMFTVTIDGEDAKDFDDAISVEKRGGAYTLFVHIADVANYVKGGSPLDKEAFKRGTSVYFPEFAIPMLPEILSNGLCSLLPNKDRYAITVKIDYDGSGKRVGTHFFSSVINSNHRLTYAGVNKILEKTDADCESGELTSFLYLAQELSDIIGKRRESEGMLNFDLPEVKFSLSPVGKILSIEPDKSGKSEKIIEHFMIEANEAAAETLLKIAPTGIFRNHLPPDQKKVLQWTKNAFYLGFEAGKLPKKPDNKSIQQWFYRIENHRFSYILKSGLVRSMQKAVYEGENAGHFGLASSAYTHFTSPIRRYPDLHVHRLLKKYYFNGVESIDKTLTQRVSKHSSLKERAADDAERDVSQLKKLAFLEANPEREYAAFVSRAADTVGIFIPTLLMHASLELPYNIKSKTLSIGDDLKVIWSRNDIDNLEAFFSAVSLEGSNEYGKSSKKSNSPHRSRRIIHQQGRSAPRRGRRGNHVR